MKARYAHQIRQGLILADLTMRNPLFAEHARLLLTPLGHAAFSRRMKQYGHSPIGGYFPL